jgi:hypothetical protein
VKAAGRRWARQALRQRWRSVVVLALITALAGGAALAAISGARRSAVVVAESMDRHRQPDVMMLPNLPGFDWRPIVELPYVESYGLLAATPLCVQETGGLENPPKAMCTQPPVEGGWYDSIWRLDIPEGRLPTAPREVAVNRLAQTRFGVRIGDRLHLAGVGPGRLDDFWEGRPKGPRPWGPSFEVTVTGVYAGDDAWRVISGGVGQPGIIASASFIPTYGKSLEYRTQAFLRLRGGEATIRRLPDDVARITGERAFPILNVRDAQRRVERSTAVEGTALLLFAAAVLATALVLVGQALTRLIRAGGGDARVLRSLGMAPSALVGALAAPGVVVGALGAAGAALVAVAASPRIPIGVARSFELDRGVKLDPPVLLLGGLGIAVIVGLVSVGSAALAVRGLRRASTPTARRTVVSIARLPVPPAVALGVRMALERRPGGDSIPVRPGLIGAAVGVLAVVAAFTIRDGVTDARAHPERAGESWDVAYRAGLADEAIARDGGVAGAAEVTRAIVDLDGLPVPAYAFRPVGAPLHRVVLDGRLPEHDDEVALGPATAARLRARVGETLPAGPKGARRVRVVGTALLVQEDGHAAYDEGAWTSAAGLRRLAPPQSSWKLVLVDVRAGADVSAVRARLARAGGTADDAQLNSVPAGLRNLETTRGLPALLGGFLAGLGAGAVGHTLVTTVRRRRRDLAVLRALGMSRRQARSVVAWQATTVGVVGLVVGLPLGIVAGRLAWRWAATSMPLDYVAPAAVLAVVVLIPGVLLVVNAVALWPGRAAARARPAAALRAE